MFLIDYNTGNEITNIPNGGWNYSIEQSTDFCKTPPGFAFGDKGPPLPKISTGQANYTVKFYITNTSYPTNTGILNLGVRFNIKDSNWSSAIDIRITNENNNYGLTPAQLKCITPPDFSKNDISLDLKYIGRLDDNKDLVDNAPDSILGEPPKDASNYNRLWTLTIGFKSSTSNDLIARMWQKDRDSTINDKFSSSQDITEVGKQSIGLYHNEFILSPIGAMVDSTMQKATRIENYSDVIELCNGGEVKINDTISESSSSLIKIYMGASFLGKCQNLSYFPPQNFIFYDQYGNNYKFSINLSALPMLYAQSSTNNFDISNIFSLSLNESQNVIENPKLDPYFLFYTTKSDHTILLDTTVRSGYFETYPSSYGNPNIESRVKIVGIGKNVFTMTPKFPHTTQFNLWYDKYQLSASGDRLFLGKDYTIKTIGKIPNLGEAAAGYDGIPSHFWFYLLPVWEGGKICLMMQATTVGGDDHRYLSLIDPNNDGKGGVGFSDYDQDYSIFTMRVDDPN